MMTNDEAVRKFLESANELYRETKYYKLLSPFEPNSVLEGLDLSGVSWNNLGYNVTKHDLADFGMRIELSKLIVRGELYIAGLSTSSLDLSGTRVDGGLTICCRLKYLDLRGTEVIGDLQLGLNDGCYIHCIDREHAERLHLAAPTARYVFPKL